MRDCKMSPESALAELDGSSVLMLTFLAFAKDKPPLTLEHLREWKKPGLLFTLDHHFALFYLIRVGSISPARAMKTISGLDDRQVKWLAKGLSRKRF